MNNASGMGAADCDQSAAFVIGSRRLRSPQSETRYKKAKRLRRPFYPCIVGVFSFIVCCGLSLGVDRSGRPMAVIKIYMIVVHRSLPVESIQRRTG